jgi:hypothetical protein
MAYQTPTPETFKARYPEFMPVSDALVQLVLDDAIGDVGDTWLEKDRARAQMLLAAHILTMEGEPGRTTTGQSSAGTGFVRRRKVGDVEVEFATPGASASGVAATGYDATAYGQAFIRLMRLNFPGPIAIVGCQDCAWRNHPRYDHAEAGHIRAGPHPSGNHLTDVAAE